MRHISFNRRRLLKGAAATGFAAANLLPAGGFAQAKTQTVNLQLGWLAGNNQIGEVAAKGMVGKKVGIQATAKVLLNALMKKHDIAEKDVEIVIIGSEMTPILTGQTDVVSGWITNTTTLKPLGPDRIDLRLWDAGVRLYALPYYATKDTIEKKADMLAAYTRAVSKGWEYALKNTRSEERRVGKEWRNS